MLLDGGFDKLREGLRAKLQPEKTTVATPLAYEDIDGVVVSSDATTPPTVTLTLAGSTTLIFGVRYFAHYTPTAGDTVTCRKRGTDLVVLGALAT